MSTAIPYGSLNAAEVPIPSVYEYEFPANVLTTKSGDSLRAKLVTERVADVRTEGTVEM